ncbi:RHS repeat-associated core domain-containing protein [Botrimarina sp.]|uniref:RHS repeat-associated core domain-containing protein n=1 Tax=Botrimarina sp. TaxID=2795802 RepID=UPI0032EC2F6A
MSDAAGRSGDSAGSDTEYEYDKVGNVEYVLGPDQASQYEYDDLYRLTELTQYREDATEGRQGGEDLIATFEYAVRDDGKRSQAIETFYQSNGVSTLETHTFDWTYDEAGRLTTETLTSTSSTLDDYTDKYGYDLAGNRLRYKHDSLTGTDRLVTYGYDANDHLLWEKTDAGANGSVNESIVYSYAGVRQSGKATYNADTEDGSGFTAEDRTTYSYNARGRLSKVEIDSDGDTIVDDTTTYKYDDNGLQVSRTESSDTKLFLLDRQNPTGYAQVLEQKDLGTQNVERAYLIGHAILGQRDGALAAYTALLSDGGGSTRAVLDATGAIANDEVYAYDAYGVRLDGHSAATDHLYRAERRDANGFDYLRARPYDFRTGRFLRMDDFAGNSDDPQSLHKYLYANGDPINGRDPSGLTNLTELSITTRTQSQTKLQSANNGVRVGATTAKGLVAIALLEMQRLASGIDAIEKFQAPMAAYNAYLLYRFQQEYRGRNGQVRLNAAIPKIIGYLGALPSGADRLRGAGIDSLGEPTDFFGNARKGTTLATTWIPMTGGYANDRRLSFATTLLGFSFSGLTFENAKQSILSAMRLAETQIRQLASNGVSNKGLVKNYLWHHNEILGVMELTDKDTHTAFTHTGGVQFYQLLTDTVGKSYQRNTL